MMYRAALSVSAMVLAVPGLARANSPLSDVLGVTHNDGKYYFGTQDFLNQGANEVVASGSKVIKVEMAGSTKSKYPWPPGTSWPGYSTLSDLAQTSYFKTLFANP